jgi:hypothetical protein
MWLKAIARFLTVLAVSLSTSYLVLPQAISPHDRKKLRRAEITADRFVDRFRQTLDFGTVWKEFRVSDASCAYRLSGPWNLSDEPGQLSDAFAEKLYVAYLNCLYLSFAYRLAVIRITDDTDDRAVEKRLPKEIQNAEQKLASIEVRGKDRTRPPNAQDVETALAELDRLAKVWRKYMPRNVMRSAHWRANIKYLLAKEGIGHLGVDRGDEWDLCIPNGETYYLVDRGLFYFYFVEENGQMKVVRFGIGD